MLLSLTSKLQIKAFVLKRCLRNPVFLHWKKQAATIVKKEKEICRGFDFFSKKAYQHVAEKSMSIRVPYRWYKKSEAAGDFVFFKFLFSEIDLSVSNFCTHMPLSLTLSHLL